MLITVTQQDCDDGVPRDSQNCPVAIALRRHLGHKAYQIFIYTHTVEINGKTVPLPTSPRQAITRFDNGKPITPFSFELDL